jgi:hypothetical protein
VIDRLITDATLCIKIKILERSQIAEPFFSEESKRLQNLEGSRFGIQVRIVVVVLELLNMPFFFFVFVLTGSSKIVPAVVPLWRACAFLQKSSARVGKLPFHGTPFWISGTPFSRRIVVSSSHRIGSFIFLMRSRCHGISSLISTRGRGGIVEFQVCVLLEEGPVSKN